MLRVRSSGQKKRKKQEILFHYGSSRQGWIELTEFQRWNDGGFWECLHRCSLQLLELVLFWVLEMTRADSAFLQFLQQQQDLLPSLHNSCSTGMDLGFPGPGGAESPGGCSNPGPVPACVSPAA